VILTWCFQNISIQHLCKYLFNTCLGHATTVLASYTYILPVTFLAVSAGIMVCPYTIEPFVTSFLYQHHSDETIYHTLPFFSTWRSCLGAWEWGCITVVFSPFPPTDWRHNIITSPTRWPWYIVNLLPFQFRFIMVVIALGGVASMGILHEWWAQCTCA